jgi:hypothetical protein
VTRLTTILAGATLALALAGPAFAADEEIQVYMDEMDRPGQFGLDLHNNYVLSGDQGVDYPGQQPSLHRYRLTPEWSYGVTPNIELGLYLPLTTLDSQGHYAADGVKGRIKFIAPKAEGQSWFWGANFEIGRVGHVLDINPWNAELKGILGTRHGRWTVATNLNLDWTVSGPQPQPASLELDTKASYAFSKDFALGVESYNGLGTFKRFGAFGENDQALYGVVDASLGKWDVDFGLGHGYGASSDGWTLKAIISVPIDD